MSRWWRAYDEAVDDPKLIMLSDKAHRAWFNLMCLTSANDGVLPHIEIIAIKLRMPEKKLVSIIEELVSRGLLDEFDGTLRPHNWNGRQYRSDVSTDRVKQFRERQRNVSVTPPETETETETDSEKKEPCRVADATPTASSKVTRIKYPEEFERFWGPYPKTPVMSKAETLKAWEKLSPEDRDAATIAVPKFAAWLKTKPDHPAVHACRFLSQRRFEGFGPGPPPERTEEQRAYLEKLERMKADAAAGRAVSWS